MRRFVIALTGLLLVTGAGGVAGAGAPAVRTVAGSGGVGSLHAPAGIALDGSGDLFVADRDHCRVMMLPSHPGTMYGMRVRAHHAYTLVGGICGTRGGTGFPTGVAVDGRGDVFIADATGQRILVVRPGTHTTATVAGTGVAGYGGDGRLALQSMLDEPTGLAVDGRGDLFIADTGNCRVRMMPAVGGTDFGRTVEAAHLYTVAGTGTCGSSGRGGAAAAAQVFNPVAVAVDGTGDLFVADNGDDDVLEVPVNTGNHYGTTIGAGDLAVIVGMGGNGPYLEDGLSATSVASELNDPEGLAVGATGTLFVTDGSMHCIRVVPSSTSAVLGRTMDGGDMYTLAGAVPVNDASGLGNGTRWILAHMNVPSGLALSASGDVLFSDRGLNQVREIR